MRARDPATCYSVKTVFSILLTRNLKVGSSWRFIWQQPPLLAAHAMHTQLWLHERACIRRTYAFWDLNA